MHFVLLFLMFLLVITLDGVKAMSRVTRKPLFGVEHIPLLLGADQPRSKFEVKSVNGKPPPLKNASAKQASRCWVCGQVGKQCGHE